MDEEARKRFESIEKRLLEIEKEMNLRHVKTAEAPIQIEQRVDSTLPEINVGELSFLKDFRLVLDKCLALLSNISEKYPQHQGLTTDEIKTIFGNKFGLTTITTNAISMVLKEATGEYVEREELEGKPVKFRYKILPAGNEHIKNKIEQLKKGEKNESE
jgi:hypothetical protein